MQSRTINKHESHWLVIIMHVPWSVPDTSFESRLLMLGTITASIPDTTATDKEREGGDWGEGGNTMTNTLYTCSHILFKLAEGS